MNDVNLVLEETETTEEETTLESVMPPTQSKIDASLSGLIFNFSTYLENLGFPITISDREMVYQLLGNACPNTSLGSSPDNNFKEQIVFQVLRTVWAKDITLYDELPDLWEKFLIRRKSFEDNLEKLEKRREFLQDQIASQKRQKQELANKAQKVKEEVNQEAKPPVKTTTKNSLNKLLDKNKEDFLKVYGDDKGQELIDILEMSSAQIISQTSQLKVKLKKGLLQMHKASNPTNVLNIVAKLSTILSNAEKEANKAEKYTKAKSRVNEQQDTINQTQNELNELFEKLKNGSTTSRGELYKFNNENHNYANSRQRSIRKEYYKYNRDIFNSQLAHNSVQSLEQGYPEFNVALNKLSAQQKNKLYDYLRSHAQAFKTRMLRSIKTDQRRRLNIPNTIKKACQTGGVPVKLIYGKKKPSRAKLLLFLDISGSCRETSELMLTFAYLIQDIFPGGCHSYAFVNSLNDITPFFELNSEEKTIKKVLNTIPTKGVYSDYGKPLRQFHEEYMGEVNNETTIIWIGDARNNTNDPEIEIFKNISRRAKRVMWLNTEPEDKWDNGDSVMGKYEPYINNLVEVTTPNQLLKFLG